MERNASQRDPLDEPDTYLDYVQRAERNERLSKWIVGIASAALVGTLFLL